ncbi:urocanate reductase precursor [Oxobacter pfennigii]|uniref:Urocanate reductase n=1 Tax=Oxobacter pfennigii TaxID=36849 RepID=A0A0P8WBM4_9CLOT|nr:FMN-binding protein [Oxobacter pfennigii]KPU45324.1 urocanate reductase precursor [Oxobacter pfennigii]
MKRTFSLTMAMLLVTALLAGCGGSKSPAYKDGTYEGEGDGKETIKVSVEVSGGKIAKIDVTEHEETEGIADAALEQIPAAIVEKNSTEVETVSGATMTSNGIIEAVNKALENAK